MLEPVGLEVPGEIQHLQRLGPLDVAVREQQHEPVHEAVEVVARAVDRHETVQQVLEPALQAQPEELRVARRERGEHVVEAGGGGVEGGAGRGGQEPGVGHGADGFAGGRGGGGMMYSIMP